MNDMERTPLYDAICDAMVAHQQLLDDDSPEAVAEFNAAITRVATELLPRATAPGVVVYPAQMNAERAVAIITNLNSHPARWAEHQRDLRMLADLHNEVAAELERDYPGERYDRFTTE